MENGKSKPVNAVPKGFHTVTPFLIVDNAKELIDFMQQAFDAKQSFLMNDDRGKIQHATVTIGDSTIMISDTMESTPAQTAMLYLYLDNVDSVFKAALRAGSTSVHEPTNEFYGDRAGAVKDRWGNVWWMATHVEEVDNKELARRAERARKERSEKHEEVHS